MKEATVIFARRRGEGYLGSQAAQHHVSEQFGSKHGESRAQHMRYNGQSEACQNNNNNKKTLIHTQNPPNYLHL